MRMFKQRLQLAVRIAIGVVLADVVQTHGSDQEWLLLPSSYYFGGLTVASMMVIYAVCCGKNHTLHCFRKFYCDNFFYYDTDGARIAVAACIISANRP